MNQTCTFDDSINKYGNFVQQMFVLRTRNDSAILRTERALQLCYFASLTKSVSDACNFGFHPEIFRRYIT